MSDTRSPFPGLEAPVLTERKRRTDYGTLFNPTVVFELYNPAEAPHRFSYDGVDYVIPGKDQHWEGRDPFTRKAIRWPRAGVLPLWDRADGRTPAAKIAKFAVGKDGYSSRVSAIQGVRLLFGDDRDEDVTSEAREAYTERHLQITEERVRQWESYVANQRSTGQAVRPMPRKVREAYNFRSSHYGALANRYACEICQWSYPEQVQVYAHTIAFHKDRPIDVAAAEAKLAELGQRAAEISLETTEDAAAVGQGAIDVIQGVGAADPRLAAAEIPLPPKETFYRGEGFEPKADPVKVEELARKQEDRIRGDVSAAARGGKTAGMAPQVVHKTNR